MILYQVSHCIVIRKIQQWPGGQAEMVDLLSLPPGKRQRLAFFRPDGSTPGVFAEPFRLFISKGQGQERAGCFVMQTARHIAIFEKCPAAFFIGQRHGR